MVRYAILGPVELCDGERRVGVGGPRQVALLALLLVNANRAVSSDRLIEELWRDLSREGALKRLQVAIARLRRVLDRGAVRGASVLRTVSGGYLLAVRPGELDAEVFQTRVEEGRRALAAGDAARGRRVLGEALEMWRGPALAPVAYEEFAQLEIRRLEELRVAAHEARVDCQQQLGEHAGVIGELEGLVAAHPEREHLAAQLMLALYRCERQGEALEVYARARAHLSGELGLEPGPALRDLQAEILGQSPGLQLICGEPGPAVPAERADVLPTGVVTFLLTDIEGSTRLWDADAGAMAAALENLERLITRLVDGHGGRLLKDKGEGDATSSVFQRASDAVACAADLQRALGTAASPARLTLRLRIALHSGETQARRGEYSGPVLNRAAQLRTLAAGGATVVSQRTAELVRGRLPPKLALVDVGRHELRGLSRPERVFELRATPDTSAGDPAGPVVLELARALHAPASSAFVGRDAELERLREYWMRGRGGARSAVVIGGEPGIGKTRLASELARAVHLEGALVLYGRCDEGLAVPYQPFVEALRPYARAVGLDRLRAELGELAPDLGWLLPELTGLGEPIRGDPESERFAFFETITALVEAMTREQRALLILDDLHWAAAPTLLLLRHLIRSERPLDVLVLCTYRETELDASQTLAQLLADLQRDASAERLNIRGLGEQAIAALVEAAVGDALDEREELVRVLAAQTAGNPFFLRELLAQVVDAGTGSPQGRRSGLAAAAARLEAPAGLRQVIGQRVARLSVPTGRALRTAAVAGPTFSFALLERVLGEESGLLDALDEAVAAGLLAEVGHGDFAFAHALVRQTIYGELGAARRMRLHRQLGEALEALDDIDTHLDALAYHFAQSAADGQGVKAADYALTAGRRASARLGFEEAAAHYDRGLQALALSGQPEQQRRCVLLLALGSARWGAGELDEARQTYLQAAALADTLGDATALARAALGFCGPYRFHLVPAASQTAGGLLQRALTALGEDDSPLRAQLMGRLAADVERKPVLARQALAMARRVANKATLADVLASALEATLGPDTLSESMVLAEELGRVAEEIGHRRLRVVAHGERVDLLLELGDIDAVERELDALEQLAQPRGERTITWALTMFRAGYALLQGRLEDCERLALDAVAYRFDAQNDPTAPVFGTQMFYLRLEQGGLDELVEAVRGFAEQYPQLPAWRCALAAMYATLERTAQARRELEALAREDFRDLPRDARWLPSLAGLTEATVSLGDVPRAQLLYELLLPYADRLVVTGLLMSYGSASRLLGLLATTLSRYEEAARHFEQALEMSTRIRSPLWIARTQHDYAAMLLLRNHPGDTDTALELLDHALATAERLGLTTLAGKARPLKLTAEEAVRSSAIPRPA